MTYYKLIDGTDFIGVGNTFDLRRYQAKHNILLTSDEDGAQFIQVNGMLFRDNWFAPIGECDFAYSSVEIETIDEAEYAALIDAIESGEEIEVEEPVLEEDISTSVDTEDITLEYVRDMKIASLSNACNKIITDGFDTILSDGEVHHFSMTIQDQLNLITLSTMVASGESVIPYHADGELCKGYSAEDISTIIATATEFKTYHVTYFNSLKLYVSSLDSITAVSGVEYGTEIPEEYQSEVLREMLKGQ